MEFYIIQFLITFLFFRFFSINSCQFQNSVDDFKYYSYRDFSDDNYCNFKSDLENTVWDLVMNSDNPEVAYDNFELLISNIHQRNFPLIHEKSNLSILTNHI